MVWKDVLLAVHLPHAVVHLYLGFPGEVFLQGDEGCGRISHLCGQEVPQVCHTLYNSGRGVCAVGFVGKGCWLVCTELRHASCCSTL